MSLYSRKLDGELLFRTYWNEMGTTRSLTLLAKQFPRNPITGERITADAGYKAMWRWACRPENFDAAYDIFRKSIYGQDPEWTKKRFYDELKEKARWMLTPHQYKVWYEEQSYSDSSQ